MTAGECAHTRALTADTTSRARTLERTAARQAGLPCCCSRGRGIFWVRIIIIPVQSTSPRAPLVAHFCRPSLPPLGHSCVHVSEKDGGKVRAVVLQRCVRVWACFIQAPENTVQVQCFQCFQSPFFSFILARIDRSSRSVSGLSTSHPGVLGSIPKRGKTGAPCVKVPGSSRVPPLSAWWLGLAPATLEIWVRFPNERNQGKQAHPVLKYRVPHGSHTLEFWVRFPNERNQGKQAHPLLKYRVPHGSQCV